jgi:hypothetical protein
MVSTILISARLLSFKKIKTNKYIYYEKLGGVGKEWLWKKLNFVLLHFHDGNENLYSQVIKFSKKILKLN